MIHQNIPVRQKIFQRIPQLIQFNRATSGGNVNLHVLQASSFPITYAVAAAKVSAAATDEWSEEVKREESAELVKRCPVCLSSNTQPEKDEFTKLIRYNFCHTVH
jgi:hypothetical protein